MPRFATKGESRRVTLTKQQLALQDKLKKARQNDNEDHIKKYEFALKTTVVGTDRLINQHIQEERRREVMRI